MTADSKHEQLRRLFDRAIELPAPARTAFLDDECRGDAELRQRLVVMLAAVGDEHFLSAPTGPRPAPPIDVGSAQRATLREGPGTRIGPYKLLQLIGEGGFGAVFMAEQEKPVARKVALKIIKLGMDTRQVVARFEQERQALSMMDHPNIARVLDAGATETGRPYFVMDLVKGAPIAEYCDKNNLTIDERLELFAQVCGAVQHAHTKGIIHRDLKPSNILVGSQDGRPQAKVIDFGIAKATSSKLTDKTLFTEHQQVIGTLQYMSPEQAEGSLDIDTRTDVYSLGVLLYELLTGSTPFDKRTVRDAMYGEIQRMIREVEPQKPSTRLSDSQETLASIAAHRRVEPRRLGSIVRGELDWIVMKSLEKDRQRRYETANGLAMDIRRYLSGEAVIAAPPSATYRFQKFVRRNKGAVAAVGAVATALLIGAVGFAWQANVARGERDNAVKAQTAEAEQRRVADTQRDRALAAENDASKRAGELKLVSDFQSRMLAQVDPTRAGVLLTADVTAKFVQALTKAGVPEAERTRQVDAFATRWKRVNATDAARELIDSTILRPAVAAVDKQFEDQPVVAAQLRQVLASRYWELGLYDAAMPLQQQALATRRRVLGDEDPLTLDSIDRMGLLLQAQGKLSEAESCYREALETCRRVLGEENARMPTLIGNLGSVLQAQGKLGDAEPLLREALDKSRRLLGEEDRETLTAINNLGTLLQAEGKLSDAEPYFREALEKSRRVLGDENRDTLISIANLGSLLRAEGHRRAAEPYFLEALEKSRRVLGELHPNTLSWIRELGLLLLEEGKLNEAEPVLREALEKSRLVLGEDHQDTLISIDNFGSLLQAQGKLKEAEQYIREASQKYRRLLGNENPDTLISINNLGTVLLAQGKWDEAEPYCREALEKRRRVLGELDPYTLSSINILGNLLHGQGKLDEAEPYLREALEKCRRVLGDEDRRTLTSLGDLGVVLKEQGKLSEAESCLREALEKSRRVLGDEDRTTLIETGNMGSLLEAQGEHAAAVELLAAAEPATRRVFTGGNARRLASLLMNLGKARAALGEFTVAEGNLIEAQAIFVRTRGETHKDTRDCTHALVEFYTAWHVAESGKGHELKAAEWRAQLEAIQLRITAPKPEEKQ